jgi:hypothetical protein
MLLLGVLTIKGQECDCQANYKWVKETFEKNDAGFEYGLSLKGKEAYEQHNQDIEQRLKEVKSSVECTSLLYEWLTFFRAGHIGIRRLKYDGPIEQKTDDQIRTEHKDWPSIALDLKSFKKSFVKESFPGYEGVWVSDPYEIAITRVGNEYAGVILKADGVYWTENQIKMKIHADGSAFFYTKNRNELSFERVEMIGVNYMKLGNIILERKYPKFGKDKEAQQYLESIEKSNPYFKQINDSTVMIKIPSFSGMRKQEIDKLIAKNLKTLLSTPNLIIDLRGNGGGSDVSFQKLLPLIYTNEVTVDGVEFFSTELNNQRMLDFINNPKYGMSDSGKEWAQASYDVLSQHMGEFYNLDSVEVDRYSFDTVYPYPANVAIMIDEGNASTTEQFLLAAKQSTKVTMYGATTMGMLDISNMYFVPSPCGEFELGYCLSRSLRIPERAIDGIGISPDVMIDPEVSEYEWVELVNQLMHQ